MNELELTNLELQIEALIHSKDQLEQENFSLRNQLTKVTRRHAQLYDKKSHTISRVKQIISQLRNDLS